MLIVLAIVVLAFLGWFFCIRDTGVPGANQTKVLTVDGTAFAFPGNWQLATATDADKKKGVFLKLNSSRPNGYFVWRFLGKPAKNVDVASLPDLIATKFTSSYKDAKIISKELIEVGGFDTVKIVY
ncbi:MAG TPA: hypothetical protein VJJ83_01540, partial [Candidatus Babeliales bacterium]|nr:hypothetical protein [Candidatus Babeliales bacterium]